MYITCHLRLITLRYIWCYSKLIHKFKYHLLALTIAIDSQTIAQHNRVETARFFFLRILLFFAINRIVYEALLEVMRLSDLLKIGYKTYDKSVGFVRAPSQKAPVSSLQLYWIMMRIHFFTLFFQSLFITKIYLKKFTRFLAS